MQVEPLRQFSAKEKAVWSVLFNGLDFCRDNQAHPIFKQGVDLLGLSGDVFPNLPEINGTLRELTGWEGVPVHGLEDNYSFFEGLSLKKFPIGNFIRDAKDVGYTPAPDIFHDLYGHLPFLTNPDYADFCQRFGEVALKYIDSEPCVERFGRLFWYGVEFPLVRTNKGIKIFGGGILSSVQESNYSLSITPKVLPFDVEVIFNKPYRIDTMQAEIFLLDSPEQLYGCLEDFEKCAIRLFESEVCVVGG